LSRAAPEAAQVLVATRRVSDDRRGARCVAQADRRRDTEGRRQVPELLLRHAVAVVRAELVEARRLAEVAHDADLAQRSEGELRR